MKAENVDVMVLPLICESKFVTTDYHRFANQQSAYFVLTKVMLFDVVVIPLHLGRIRYCLAPAYFCASLSSSHFCLY